MSESDYESDNLFYASDVESDFSGFDSDDLPVADLIRDADSATSSSDEDDEVVPVGMQPVREWTDQFSPPTIEPFTGNPGPNLPDDFDTATASPLDFFWLLFPLELVTLLVQFTNSYAVWKLAQPGTRPDTRWYDTTVPEMRAFLGINILMGIVDLPRLEMYWSSDPFLQNVQIMKTMTCNRFQKLLQFFHASDRAAEPARGQPGYDLLYKIRPVMTRLRQTFKDAYTLSREVSIDEGMIGFTGRLSYRQYMPAKPIKRGVKVWMLADANSSYLSRFQFYLGRQENGMENGLGYKVVMKLSEDLRNSNRHLYFDNFFTSIPLMEDLQQNGLYACGTVRPMRKGFPKELHKPRDVRNRGAYRILQKGDTNLTASVWMDKKHVHHLSTLSDPRQPMETQRRVGRVILDLPVPHSVHEYNRFMGGVDRHDQHRACYSVSRKGKKAWRYMFWFMLNSAIINAFILYKSASSRVTKRRRFAHLDFRMELLKQLIGGFIQNKKRPSPSSAGYFEGITEGENINGHINSRLPGKGKRCRLHLKQQVRRQTVYGCSVCHAHLCKECHGPWHNQ